MQMSGLIVWAKIAGHLMGRCNDVALSSRALERAVQIQEVTLRAASGEDPVDASGQDFLGKVPASLFNNVRQDKGQTRGTSATVIRKIKTVRRAPTFRKSANR